MRTLKLYSTQANDTKEVVVNDNATWGEVKRAASEQGLSVDDMKAVGRESQYTFSSETATIPPEDQTIFLTPSKVKSGNANG